MAKALIQCAYDGCRKSFNVDFGETIKFPFDISCPKCHKLNSVNLKITPKDGFDVPGPHDPGSIICAE